MGAPGLDFQTWESTDLHPPNSTCHPEWSAAKSKDLLLLFSHLPLLFIVSIRTNMGAPSFPFVSAETVGDQEPLQHLSRVLHSTRIDFRAAIFIRMAYTAINDWRSIATHAPY